MCTRLLLVALLLLGLSVRASAAQRAFALLEVSGIDRSEQWYRKVFNLRVANRTSRPTHEHRMLVGEDMLIELVQSKPPRAPASQRTLRIGKIGVEVADFDRKLAALRRAGIAPPGGLISDEAIGLATVLLRDPDGNIIQLFGKSAGPFDGVVQLSPDMAPKAVAR